MGFAHVSHWVGYSKLKNVGFLIKNRPEVHVWDSPAQTTRSSPLGATVLGAIYGAEQENMEIDYGDGTRL